MSNGQGWHWALTGERKLQLALNRGRGDKPVSFNVSYCRHIFLELSVPCLHMEPHEKEFCTQQRNQLESQELLSSNNKRTN